MNKTNVFLTVLAVCAILFAAFGINAPATEAADTEYQRQVSVTGEAELKIDPNLAILSVTVETENKSAQIASTKNATAMNKVIEALKKAGVDADTISTEGYSMHPIYHWNDGKKVDEGYRVVNNIKFETKKLDEVGKLFDLAVKNGATRINSPQFTVADQDEIKMQLLELAMKNAMEKADVLVKAAGASRGVVVTINEQGVSGNFYRTPNFNYDMATKNVAAEMSTPIQVGDVELTARISVTFAIQ